ELVDRRINHSQEAVREGDILPLRIIRIERDRHRLGLSLKQARDRGEIMGFTFSPDGEVIHVPDHIRAAFRDEVAAVLREAREEGDEPLEEDASSGETPRASQPSSEAREAPAPTPAQTVQQMVEEREDDMPQTQMAAAFAA